MLAALNHLEGSTLSFCILGFSRILHDLPSSSCHISWPPKLWDVGGTHICHSLSPSIPPCSTLSLQLTNRSVTRVTQALPLKPFARKSSRGIGFEMPVQMVLGFFFFFWLDVIGPESTGSVEFGLKKPWIQSSDQALVLGAWCSHWIQLSLKYREVSAEFGEDQRWCKVPSKVLTTRGSLIKPLT